MTLVSYSQGRKFTFRLLNDGPTTTYDILFDVALRSEMMSLRANYSEIPKRKYYLKYHHLCDMKKNIFSWIISSILVLLHYFRREDVSTHSTCITFTTDITTSKNTLRISCVKQVDPCTLHYSHYGGKI